MVGSMVCSSIFAVHESWRYRLLSQRWSIALKCLEICNQVAGDCSWNGETVGRDIDTSSGVKLLNSFLTDSSLFQVLFSILSLSDLLLVCYYRNVHRSS